MNTALIAPTSWKHSRRHRHLVVGTLLTLSWLLMALLSLVWTPDSAFEMNFDNTLAPPSLTHWLGTDAFGRDTASLLLLGARSSLAVGVIAVGLGLLVGVALGLWAAARRGWVQEVIMRTADLILALPAILLAIMLTTAFGPGMVNAIIAIGVVNIPIFLRITRANAHSVWSRDFVLAARSCGCSTWRITWEHVLPNILPVLVVQATIQFAMAILAEAALSYMGLGTQAPQPSWGRMLSEAQTLLFQTPWLAIFPGMAIALSVLGLNLLGDGLRDWLDPRGVRQR